MPGFPTIRGFEKEVRGRAVGRFYRLSGNRFGVTRTEMERQTVDQVPSFGSVGNTESRVTVLGERLGGREQLVPLHGLFVTVPGLMASLHPYFVVSPLSIDMFLRTRDCSFSLIVFSRTSRIRARSTVNTVVENGRIVVINSAGRLPPADFFSASLGSRSFSMSSSRAVRSASTNTCRSVLSRTISVLPRHDLE